MLKNYNRLSLVLVIIASLLFVAACGSNNENSTNSNSGTSETTANNKEAAAEMNLSGTIEIDGSSTVFPITEGIAEEFSKIHKDVRVPVGVSGTGGGFKRFCAGETAISNASRPIKDSEAELCKTAGIEFIELAVAYDGLSVIVNPDNDWVDHLTVEELHAIFMPGSTVKTWADVRAGWPAETIKMYSPGADSGTFDYFTEAINDEAQASRNDSQITFSEDDNTLVQGISGDKYAIGYFGFAYFEENQDMLKLVPVDGGTGPIAPSEQTINDGTYAPLSRPLYIYANKAGLSRPEVKEFLSFYMENAPAIAGEVGYIELPAAMYEEGIAKLN